MSHVLCPKLQPGDVAVIGNLSSQKVKGVREAIEAAGAEELYLPPYSPDLNSIEKASSKLKQLLCSANAHTAEANREGYRRSTDLLPEISADNAQAWSRLRLGASRNCESALDHFGRGDEQESR